MRVTRGKVNRKRHKKVLDSTKGYKGSRATIFRAAMQAMTHAGRRAFKDRRIKKRDFRGLWIQRINAAANLEDVSYSFFINGLKKSNIILNRKSLAELAANDPVAFKELVKITKFA